MSQFDGFVGFNAFLSARGYEETNRTKKVRTQTCPEYEVGIKNKYSKKFNNLGSKFYANIIPITEVIYSQTKFGVSRT